MEDRNAGYLTCARAPRHRRTHSDRTSCVHHRQSAVATRKKRFSYRRDATTDILCAIVSFTVWSCAGCGSVSGPLLAHVLRILGRASFRFALSARNGYQCGIFCPRCFCRAWRADHQNAAHWWILGRWTSARHTGAVLRLDEHEHGCYGARFSLVYRLRDVWRTPRRGHRGEHCAAHARPEATTTNVGRHPDPFWCTINQRPCQRAYMIRQCTHTKVRWADAG